MHITIAERLKPFSHLSGQHLVLPNSYLSLQIFPALIRIFSLEKATPQLIEEHPLPIVGPVSDFTVQQDLEKEEIKVWGKAENGYFRYCVQGEGLTWKLIPEKGSIPSLGSTSKIEPKRPMERLSLGNHKAQDWELIQRRADFTEIFPLWHRLGQLMPQVSSHSEGTATLLERCREKIDQHDILNILNVFRQLRLTGFSSGIFPQLQDISFQGIEIPKIASHASSPLFLLSEGASLIRSLFIQQNKNLIKLLPAVPPDFHCGRLIHVKCGQIGTFHIEWSKKMIRRVIFHADNTNEVSLQLPKAVKQYRIRQGKMDKGIRIHRDNSFSAEAGVTYWLDRFEA